MSSTQDPPISALSDWMGAVMRYRSDHPSTQKILDVLERLLDRPYRTHALIRGEPGTGKEGLARALHSAMHPEDNAPFVKMPTGGRDPAVLSLHLFGTADRPGAIERAEGGTLFLDEVATMSREVQARLSPALRGRFRRNDDEAPREANLVVIGATDHDLSEQVRQGTFRHDLFYRLARLDLRIPALRERNEDIPQAAVWVANRLLSRHGEERSLGIEGEADEGELVLTTAALAALGHHEFRGNFRELDLLMERALMLYREGDQITETSVRRAIGKR
ncbi:MAG: sigma-54-dependent Fis family transcriptional regulator [Deltaproteobacteria bacterium]|nr:sigma-54-dependent Fis family transcriptional regulator [Deltaproteobacteria bacterium]